MTVGEHSTYFHHDAEPLEPPSNTSDMAPQPPIDLDDHDIYRGRPPSPESISSSSSSSSSSSASSGFGGRLGAISAVVEHAIGRWARAWASSSSIETASTASETSLVTVSKSQISRRRKRLSVADLHNARSEREIAARLRAREESRYIPCAFDLYVPHALDMGAAGLSAEVTTVVGPDGQERHILHTSSLPVLIAHLSAALKDNVKPRRGRTDAGQPDHPHSILPVLHHDYMMPVEFAEAPALRDTHARRRAKKGKSKASTPASASQLALPSRNDEERPKKAWWLDVSSPTWEDMRAIGKLLHLHPLTLEDILQQDPREKLELFPKLGYHFIVFRAIESQKTRDRFRALGSGYGGVADDSNIGEVNVYLVVFREGICSFHFADIAEHVDRVRSRIMKLAENMDMSSDWIAHGLMDSIVDSVFPLLAKIEEEVDDIEALVASSHDNFSATEISAESISSSGSDTIVVHDRAQIAEKRSTSTIAEMEEDKESPKDGQRKIQFSLPTQSPSSFDSWKKYIKAVSPHFRVVFTKSSTAVTKSTVHRMARTRRLVTSLARFLAHKTEVVAQIQKRLASGEWGIGNGAANDVFVYMGDVQDHIITFQQSLAHYERVLSQSHPTYLSHLRLSVSQAQSGTDRAFVVLSTVSFGVLCVQTVIGLNSMNVTIVTNSLDGNNFSVFGIVLAASFLVLIVYGFFVRYVVVNSKTNARRRL